MFLHKSNWSMEIVTNLLKKNIKKNNKKKIRIHHGEQFLKTSYILIFTIFQKTIGRPDKQKTKISNTLHTPFANSVSFNCSRSVVTVCLFLERLGLKHLTELVFLFLIINLKRSLPEKEKNKRQLEQKCELWI